MATATLIDQVLAHAAHQPHATAVHDDVQRLSYRQLADAALGLAAVLQNAGLEQSSDAIQHGTVNKKHGTVIAIVARPSRHAIIAMLAVHAAGASYFFVDLREPIARTHQLLKRMGVKLVVCDPSQRAIAEKLLALRQERILISSEEIAAPVSYRAPQLQEVAYWVATSGSSGTPKCVMVSHRGVLPMLREQVQHFGIDVESRVLLGTPLRFDASLSDIGCALTAGAQLHIPPRRSDPVELRQFMEARRVSHADLPPAMIRLLGSPPQHLKVMIFGGEVVQAEQLKHWARSVRVIACYGPSEATVCSSVVEVDPERWSAHEIGAPFPHMRYRVVDEAGNEVPPGQSGELWIAGAGLALGYLDEQPEPRQPFLSIDGTRWYRSGDQVAQRDGRWLFFGRRGRRVKLNGRLVHPEEIERAVTAAPGVLDAAVVVQSLSRNHRPDRLTSIAFVVPQPREQSSDKAPTPLLGQRRWLHRLRTDLAERLPTGLVPRVESVSCLPRTASGKPDLLQLTQCARSLQTSPSRTTGQPRGTPIAMLCQLLAEILALPEVMPDDDFVALGGDSLAALELVAAAALAGLQLSSASVMTARTCRRMIKTSLPTRIPYAQLHQRVHPYLPAGPPPLPTPSIAQRTSRSAQTLLLSGATGFFGAQLLHRLANTCPSNPITHVYCLVRASSAEEADTRLTEALQQQQLTRNHKMTAVVGDCLLPQLGMSQRDYATLMGKVDTVVHSAASLSAAAPFANLLDDNVRATRNMLLFSRIRSIRAFHLISSLAVLLCAEGTPPQLNEHTDVETITALHGGYAATKWCAERLLQAVPNTAIHRLGLLGPALPNGYYPSNDILRAFIRGIHNVGKIPTGDHQQLRFDLTPVGLAAESVATLVAKGKTGQFHISSRRGASLAQLLEAFRQLGQTIVPTSIAAFDTAVGRYLTPSSARAALALSSRLRGDPRPDMDLFLMSQRQCHAEHTQTASGVVIPEPTIQQLIEQIKPLISLDGGTAETPTSPCEGAHQ